MIKTARLAMKKRFYALLCRFGRRYVYPTRSLFGTWGLYCEYGVHAGKPFREDCTLRDWWIIIEPGHRGYWDERGETEPLYWHRIGCRRIVLNHPDLCFFRKIVRLTHDELWLKTELGYKREHWYIECYRRGTPPPDPDLFYELCCASLDKATENDR